jgi:hypothetical protein
MNEVVEALIDAQVEYELSRFRGEGLPRILGEHVGATLRWLGDVKLDDVVTREQIVGIIDRNVIELRVSGGITELAGEMARVVLSSKTAANVNAGQVLPPGAYEEFADQILSLERLRHDLISLVAHSSAFANITSRILAQAMTDLLFRRESTRVSDRPLGLAELASMLEARVLPELERRVEGAISRFIEQHRGRIARDSERHLLEILDAECLRSIADEFWDSISSKRLSDVFAQLGEHDLEDFVVLCFEFWLKFRRTPYFRGILVELVAHFFSKYGDQSVLSLIEDMGVTEAMVLHELNTVLGPLLQHAEVTGFFEQRLRAHLEPFYRSQGVAAILDSRRAG